jgi:hypothetical protein
MVHDPLSPDPRTAFAGEPALDLGGARPPGGGVERRQLPDLLPSPTGPASRRLAIDRKPEGPPSIETGLRSREAACPGVAFVHPDPPRSLADRGAA